MVAQKKFGEIIIFKRKMFDMKLFFCFLIGSAFIGFVHGQTDQPMLGFQAPAFELQSLEGKTISLNGLKGKYVVVHFAATWCPFCNAEAPNLEQLNKDYRDKNVQVLLIDVKEEKTTVQNLLSKFNFSFPVLLDPDGSVSAKYAPEGLLPDLARAEVPIAANLIIDKQGKIRFYSLLNTANFDAKLNALKEKLNELLANEK
jgi:peroxiredoxin